MNLSKLLMAISLLCTIAMAGIDRVQNQTQHTAPVPAPIAPLASPQASEVATPLPTPHQAMPIGPTGQMQNQRMGKIEHYARHKLLRSIPAMGHKLARRPKFTWWMGALAFIVLCVATGAVLTGAKGWPMTLSNILTNSIRVFGIFIVLFLIGLTVYGIINGGRI